MTIGNFELRRSSSYILRLFHKIFVPKDKNRRKLNGTIYIPFFLSQILFCFAS